MYEYNNTVAKETQKFLQFYCWRTNVAVNHTKNNKRVAMETQHCLLCIVALNVIVNNTYVCYVSM